MEPSPQLEYEEDLEYDEEAQLEYEEEIALTEYEKEIAVQLIKEASNHRDKLFAILEEHAERQSNILNNIRETLTNVLKLSMVLTQNTQDKSSRFTLQSTVELFKQRSALEALSQRLAAAEASFYNQQLPDQMQTVTAIISLFEELFSSRLKLSEIKFGIEELSQALEYQLDLRTKVTLGTVWPPLWDSLTSLFGPIERTINSSGIWTLGLGAVVGGLVLPEMERKLCIRLREVVEVVTKSLETFDEVHQRGQQKISKGFNDFFTIAVSSESNDISVAVPLLKQAYHYRCQLLTILNESAIEQTELLKRMRHILKDCLEKRLCSTALLGARSTLENLRFNFISAEKKSKKTMEAQMGQTKDLLGHFVAQLSSSSVSNAMSIQKIPIWEQLSQLTDITTPSKLGIVGVAATGATLLLGEMKIRTEVTKMVKELDKILESFSETHRRGQETIRKYFGDVVSRLKHQFAAGLLLIWFNKQMATPENQATLNLLRTNFPMAEVTPCDDISQFKLLLQQSSAHDVAVVTSGSSGKEVMDVLLQSCNVLGIIVYCQDIKLHQQWSKDYLKICAVVNTTDALMVALNNVVHRIRDFTMFGFGYEELIASFPQKGFQYYMKQMKCPFNPLGKARDLGQLKATLSAFWKDLGKDPPMDLEKLHILDDEFARTQSDPKKLLNLYTKKDPPMYKLVNGILNQCNEPLILEVEAYFQSLRNALFAYDDGLRVAGSLTCYRGISLGQEQLQKFRAKFKMGDLIVFPAFTSTSLQEVTAKKFLKKSGGVIIIITIDKDIVASQTRPKLIKQISAFPKEDELLFPCFSVLKVNKITPQRSHDLHDLYECTLCSECVS